LVTTAAVIAIQMGYLIGVVVRVGIDRGLTAALRDNSSPASKAGGSLISSLEAAVS
jgi:hypothetical protein